MAVISMTEGKMKNNSKWSVADQKANKQGLRHTVFQVNGNEYRGEWKDNKRHGRGIYKWKKANVLYEGDWENDMRCGSGVLSVMCDNGKQVKIYSGEWRNDKRHGFGQNWYSDQEIYEGEWCADKRWGWGRMYYLDGSIYEGQWVNDKRCGDGMLRLRKWDNDKKNGRGKYFFLRTGQLMEGVWVDDIPKCCQMIDLGRELAVEGSEFEIPEIKLEDPNGVLRETHEKLLAKLPH
ncbi:MORN repeat-containing protein 3 [Fasciola hepatica]|uniref:MORN repeat-containing protein 3 n=2 Tax=Fasciola TaxID=6191 RepID=A0A4E0RPX6_FASHE|nr:MORN repeat-containing protein 3 [Fasciola hepatica]